MRKSIVSICTLLFLIVSAAYAAKPKTGAKKPASPHTGSPSNTATPTASTTPAVTATATATATVIATATTTATATATESNDTSRHFLFHHGLTVLNPFKIADNHIQASGETDVKYYMEISYRNRAIWNESADKENYNVLRPDFECRFGTVIQSEKASGAAIGGTGDFYADAEWGLFPLQIDRPKGKRTNSCSVNFVPAEALVGGNTDRGAQSIHGYWGIGPAGVFAMTTSSGKPIEFHVGTYWAEFPVPSISNDAGLVAVSPLGFPEFQSIKGWLFKVDAQYPISSGTYIVIGSRFGYPLHKDRDNAISPWTVKVGLSFNILDTLQNVSSILLPKSDTSADSSTATATATATASK